MRTLATASHTETGTSVMSKIRSVLSSFRQYFRETLRYTRGGEPIPEALDGLAEFLFDREDLSSESWVSDICRDLGVSAEVAAFAFDFFASQGVPIGRVRPGDRLTEDLNLTEALRDDWDVELQIAFAQRFSTRRLFKSGPKITTVSELLLLMQQELNARVRK